ncbi:flagellar assembly peptidoglycan hydrolase FlgJ [Pseudoduganella sp. LjRoot289]|uniref:flagellar assembly peptidoglycan hydrolase FlgJ n=1 Tax=Pseudoduganella sp. LjRoot289 TaxID=3342314 RepID=UPI003ED011E6
MIRQSPATNDLSATLATDVNGMGKLRQSAREGSPEALKGAATQFEAMFINMMMKSMREASPGEGMLDNQQTKMFTTMLDQQTSQNLAKKGVGLSDVLVRQLSKQNDQALALGGEPGAADASGIANSGNLASAAMAAKLQRAIAAAGGTAAANNAANNAAGAKADASAVGEAGKGSSAPHVRAFQAKLGSHADEASKATGIPAKFMLGQAALESGWGKREIKGRDGSASHNLFGIKAGPEWKGKVAEAVTTEYVNGKPQTRVERFRAYDSYADSFKDYAKLLTNNPRYEKVLASAKDASGFAHGLQKAGYATDPQYAAKLTRIIKQSLA